MKHSSFHTFANRWRFTLALVFSHLVLGSGTLRAQDDGPRWYWMAPDDTHVVNAYAWYTEGNAQPLGPSNFDPQLKIESLLGIAGYNYYTGLFGRSASATLWVPFGYAEARLTGVGRERSSGLGDLYWGGTINLLGVPSMSLEEFVEHEPGTIINLGIGGELPTGAYDDDRFVNMGQNRYSFRLSLPIIQPLGNWQPGEYTTIEVMPSVWFYTDNDDAMGQRLEQDPLFMIEAHVTRDVTEWLWLSLDYQYTHGGETSLDGVDQGDNQAASFLGGTVGFNLSEQTSVTLRYQGGLADPKDDLQLDIFRLEVNLVF